MATRVYPVPHTSWQKLASWTRNFVAVSNRGAAARAENRGFSMVSKQGVALISGVFLLIGGLFLAISWDSILEAQVNKEFLLTETSQTYEPWKKSKVEVYIRFWFWNWTNPSNMRDPDYKPSFVECGPYAYRETQEKINVVWNRNGTVTYKRRRRWYFDPDQSNGTIDDIITTLEVVPNSAAYISRYDGYSRRLGLNGMMMMTQRMEVRKPVRELLFEGYSNPLLNAAQGMSWLTNHKVPFDRFGWFYKRNGSEDSDGTFNIETGANGMDHFGEIREWNYQNHTPFFDDECGAVKGSGGEFFPPKRTKEDVILLFSSDLCRYVSFHYKREETIEDIAGYRYEMKSSMLDNGEEDPSNSCFCRGECPPPGALNVSECRFGAPAFVSYPHFYMADSEYRENVDGMSPDPAKHGSHITMEPKYGVTLEVAARFQVNILVQPHNDISLYSGLHQQVYFPVMWFEQTARIPSDTASAIRMLLLMPTVGMSVSAILIVVGTALIGSVIAVRTCTPSKRLNISDGEENKRVTEPMMQENGLNKEEIPKESIKWDTKL